MEIKRLINRVEEMVDENRPRSITMGLFEVEHENQLGFVTYVVDMCKRSGDCTLYSSNATHQAFLESSEADWSIFDEALWGVPEIQYGEAIRC